MNLRLVLTTYLIHLQIDTIFSNSKINTFTYGEYCLINKENTTSNSESSSAQLRLVGQGYAVPSTSSFNYLSIGSPARVLNLIFKCSADDSYVYGTRFSFDSITYESFSLINCTLENLFASCKYDRAELRTNTYYINEADAELYNLDLPDTYSIPKNSYSNTVYTKVESDREGYVKYIKS